GGMRRVGRHEEDALAAIARSERECRRAGGLAHAALATEKDDAAIKKGLERQPGSSTTRQRREWRVLDAHPAMPRVKLLEEVRIHLEQVKRRRVRQRGGFHETQQREEIVEIRGLAAELAFVRPARVAAHHLREMAPRGSQIVGPAHLPTINLMRAE